VCPSLLWVTDKRAEYETINMASEVGQHAIDQSCSKDTFSNMQAGLVAVVSKKMTIHENMRN
jgi:hypothetical protein